MRGRVGVRGYRRWAIQFDLIVRFWHRTLLTPLHFSSYPFFPVLLGRSTRALWWRVRRTWAWRCSSRWSSCPIFTSPASPCWRPTAFPRLTTTSSGYACAGTDLFPWLRREMAHGPNTPLTHGGGRGLSIVRFCSRCSEVGSKIACNQCMHASAVLWG